nr:hypothetical membrane protein [uncultured archaeon]
MKLSMASITVLLILTAIAVTSLAVTPVIVAAQEVEVTVNAPEYVEERATFVATIDVDDVTDLNSAQFDLSFDSSVVKVSDVNEGEIDGEDVPIFDWRFVDTDTVMVIIMMPIGESLSGSGYLAEIEFKVKCKEGEGTELSLSNGELVNATTGGIIPSNWHGAEVKIAVEEKDDEEEEEEEEVEEVEEVGEEVTPVSSNITAWKPAEAVVNDTADEPRTFEISVGQISDISWQINGTEVQTNESVTEASFTQSADIGSWNVSAIATNTTTRLSEMHTWIWRVAATATVTPTEVVGEIPPAETEVEATPTPTLAPRVTPKPTAPSTTEKKPTPTPTPPGFEAILAIAVMPIAYILLRRGGR